MKLCSMTVAYAVTTDGAATSAWAAITDWMNCDFFIKVVNKEAIFLKFVRSFRMSHFEIIVNINFKK